jgi:broad specificity phosphatase PhoE
VRIDRAVASPLSRAKRTAELALGAARESLLKLDSGFAEIAHGTWEGLLASEIGAMDGERLRAWREAPETVQMPQGESLQQVLDRAWPALERATIDLGADDTLLVVAHDAVNRVLLCRILGLPLSRLWTFRQAPTTINLLEGPDRRSSRARAAQRLHAPHRLLRRSGASRVVVFRRRAPTAGVSAFPRSGLPALTRAAAIHGRPGAGHPSHQRRPHRRSKPASSFAACGGSLLLFASGATPAMRWPQAS